MLPHLGDCGQGNSGRIRLEDWDFSSVHRSMWLADLNLSGLEAWEFYLFTTAMLWADLKWIWISSRILAMPTTTTMLHATWLWLGELRPSLPIASGAVQSPQATQQCTLELGLLGYRESGEWHRRGEQEGPEGSFPTEE